MGKRLSKPGRISAAVFITIGLLTFFVPLITTEPPVSGISRWSLLQIALRPPTKVVLYGITLNVWQSDFGVVYLLLFVTLISTLFFPSRKLLGTIGLLGAVVTQQLWRFAQTDLDLTFYGSVQANKLPPFLFGKGVNLTPLILVLLGIMLLVALISWVDLPTASPKGSE
jgi:hypothetical protein